MSSTLVCPIRTLPSLTMLYCLETQGTSSTSFFCASWKLIVCSILVYTLSENSSSSKDKVMMKDTDNESCTKASCMNPKDIYHQLSSFQLNQDKQFEGGILPHVTYNYLQYPYMSLFRQTRIVEVNDLLHS